MTNIYFMISLNSFNYLYYSFFWFMFPFNWFYIAFKDYKVPMAKDIPVDFRISLLKDAPNPLGVLSAKG